MPHTSCAQNPAAIQSVSDLQAYFLAAYTNEDQAILYPVSDTGAVFHITLGVTSFASTNFQHWITNGWPYVSLASGVTGYPVFFEERKLDYTRVKFLTGLDDFPLFCWTNYWNVNAWIESAYGEVPYWENATLWRAIRDPSRLHYSMTLVPAEAYEAWLDLLCTTSEHYVVNHEVPEELTNNLFIVTCSGQTPPFRLYLPPGKTNAEIFSTQELTPTDWTLKNTLYNPGPYSQLFINESLQRGYLQAADADIDTDGDGLSNAREDLIYGTRADLPDTDGDGIPDGPEILTYGLDPWNPDCDGDGLPDGLEVFSGYSLNPLSPDSDGDGIPDGDEDTDGDGMPNDVEIACGLNPFSDDAMLDSDNDGYPNIYECINSSDPFSSNNIPQATVTCSPSSPGGIQQAINSATGAYSIVKLNSGIYTGASNRNLSLGTVPAFITGPSSGEAIIDCEQNGCGFFVVSNTMPRTLVTRLTVRNATSGFHLLDSTITVRDCVIKDCSLYGAVLAGTNYFASVERSLIKNNAQGFG
ncbi:MAG: hypothetical protein PHG65_10085, partial [Kiritimatiellae bacterium]|nr:hypothetical protein [Kiritimatiellia bacterium]